jgi:uncharacterized protein
MSKITQTLWIAACGLLAGLSLVHGGLTDPAIIRGALDVFGDFDPSMPAFMAGALTVFVPLQRLARRLSRPFFAVRFHMPTKKDLEPKLLVGAAIFGVGWAIAGICPGPATVNLGTGSPAAMAFFVSMLVGLRLGRSRLSATFAASARRRRAVT